MMSFIINHPSVELTIYVVGTVIWLSLFYWIHKTVIEPKSRGRSSESEGKNHEK